MQLYYSSFAKLVTVVFML